MKVLRLMQLDAVQGKTEARKRAVAVYGERGLEGLTQVMRQVHKD